MKPADLWSAGPWVLFGALVAFMASGAAQLGQSRGAAPRPGKAFYRTLRAQHHDPHVLAKLQAATRGAVAIADARTHAPVASGVLVGPDLVLTAGHVRRLRYGDGFRLRPAAEIEVIFDHVRDAEGRVQAGTRYPVLGFVADGYPLDFVFLRLGPDAGGALPDQARVRALSHARPRLDDAVTVLGHPEGRPLKVIDGGVVVLPYRAERADLTALVRREEGTDELARAIRKSYRRGQDAWLRHWSPVFDQPVLGIDSDAMNGCSGGGVYLKETGQLVGILIDGQPDVPHVWRGGWHRHEAVLPAVAILEHLRRDGSSLPAGLTVEPDSR